MTLKRTIKIVFAVIVVVMLPVIFVESIVSDGKLSIHSLFKYVPYNDIVVLKENINETIEVKEYNNFFPVEAPQVKSYTYKFITDKDGCRTNENGKTFNSNNINLGLIGDSFTAGMDAEYSHTIQGYLEDNYSDFNIVNFSVPAASSFNYYKNLDYYQHLKNIKLNIAVIGLYVDMENGDLPRILAREKYGELRALNGQVVGREKYEEINASRIKMILFNLEVFLRKNSSLFNKIYPPKASHSHSISLSRKLNKNDFEEYSNKILTNILKIQNTAGLTPSKTVIFFVPSKSQYVFHFIKDSTNPEDKEFFILSIDLWNTIKTKLEIAGYVVVDPRNSILDESRELKITPFNVDGHLNEKGYSIVTKEIIKKINDIAFL